MSYETLTYDRAIRDNLQFMDQAAIALCRENKLPIVVFNLLKQGNVRKVLSGDKIGTIISDRRG